MASRLEIREAAYVLARSEAGGWRETARLAGGAAALLRTTGRGGVDDLAIESAIERAEDWLMPRAKGRAGEVLEVLDVVGRLVAGLGRSGTWSPQEVEDAFNRLLALPPGQRPPEFAADVVLLREWTHHARIARVEVLAGR